MTDQLTEEAFWDEAEDKPKYGLNESRGRYEFPDPPGWTRPKGMSKGFMRMTNLAGAFSDQMRLQLWRERMILLGLREDEVLFDELAAAPIEEWDAYKAKEWLERHANRAASVAKADQGSRRGTARHLMLQSYVETGLLTGTRTMRLQLESLLETLERHELDIIPGWSERRVCNTICMCIGTLDLGVSCRRTGQVGILDLKTAKAFWTYQEACGQQWGYDAAPWAWEGTLDDSGSWVRPLEWNLLGSARGPAPGRRVALLAHMPHEPGPHQLPVELHEVDLDYGREVMLVALNNVRLRSIGSSVADGRRVGGKREGGPVEVLATSAITG